MDTFMMGTKIIVHQLEELENWRTGELTIGLQQLEN